MPKWWALFSGSKHQHRRGALPFVHRSRSEKHKHTHTHIPAVTDDCSGRSAYLQGSDAVWLCWFLPIASISTTTHISEILMLARFVHHKHTHSTNTNTLYTINRIDCDTVIYCICLLMVALLHTLYLGAFNIGVLDEIENHKFARICLPIRTPI